MLFNLKSLPLVSVGLLLIYWSSLFANQVQHPVPSVQSVPGWLPNSAHNLYVVNAPVRVSCYPVCQPCGPESSFEAVIVFPILERPQKSITENSSWVRPKDISACAGTFDRGWLGPMCIYCFLNNDKARAQELVKTMAGNANASFLTSGTIVYEFNNGRHVKDHEVNSKYLCMPNPGLMIYSNNKTQIVETLHNRMTSKGLALPASFPEWELLDTKAHYWGIRQFKDDEPAHGQGGQGYNFSYYDSGTLICHYWLSSSLAGAPFLERNEKTITVKSRNRFGPLVDVLEYVGKSDRSLGNSLLIFLNPWVGGLSGRSGVDINNRAGLHKTQ